MNQVWSQKIGTQLSAAHTVVESGSNVIVGGGLYKVWKKPSTNIYVLVAYAYISSLYIYILFAYIFIAYLSLSHIYLHCIYILVAGLYWKDASHSYGS